VDVQLRRDRGRLPRNGLWASGAIHAAVLAVLLFGPAFQATPPQFETFAIELVATNPLPEPLPPATEELVVETPDPAPPAPPEEIPPPPLPDPDPEPEPTPPPPDPEPVREETPPAPPDTPPAEPTPTPAEPAEEPAEEAEETGSNVNVRLEGLRRDYPAYYGNIVQQIGNCFRPPPGNNRWEAVVYFEIRADGTVSGVRPVQRSGSQAFDLAAIGAVADCAGRGRFGPLPDDLPYEVLPVQFTFRPRGIGQ
jgi:outer membrane biosynthesis protein TonB